jgi:hypothetical protein
MAKITKATRGGRTIYKIAGTSKYAFTLAKAKEVAAKMGGAKRTTAGKRVGRGRGSVEEGYFDTKGRRGVRVSRKKPTAAAAKKYAAFESELALDVVRSVKGGLTGYLKAHNAFKKDAYKAAAKYDVNADYISPKFVRTVLRELASEIDDLEGLRKQPATRKKTPRKKPARVTKAYAAPASKALRRPAKGGKKYARQRTGRALYRTPKLIGRAYTNRYGERVGPTRILGRTVDYAMKIVRTKGRDLKATPAHRKEIVAKYRKGLQKAGFLRGAATRSNSGRTMQYFKEVVCEGGHGGGGCGSPLAIHKITQETFEAARGPKRSNAWFEHNEDEEPEVDGPFKVVLGYRLCRDCRE